MDEYQAGLLRAWFREDAIIAAHFEYCATMQYDRADRVHHARTQEEKQRSLDILVFMIHAEWALKRFEAQRKDHEYWWKRWSAIHITELDNEARGVVMVPLIKEGQTPKKV